MSDSDINIVIEREAIERIGAVVTGGLGVIWLDPVGTVTGEERIEAMQILVATTINETIRATATEIVAQLVEAGVSAQLHLSGTT